MLFFGVVFVLYFLKLSDGRGFTFSSPSSFSRMMHNSVFTNAIASSTSSTSHFKAWLSCRMESTLTRVSENVFNVSCLFLEQKINELVNMSSVTLIVPCRFVQKIIIKIKRVELNYPVFIIPSPHH